VSSSVAETVQDTWQDEALPLADGLLTMAVGNELLVAGGSVRRIGGGRYSATLALNTLRGNRRTSLDMPAITLRC